MASSSASTRAQDVHAAASGVPHLGEQYSREALQRLGSGAHSRSETWHRDVCSLERAPIVAPRQADDQGAGWKQSVPNSVFSNVGRSWSL